MHPARSVIIFTSLSGLGLGLMVFLGLGFLDVSGWVAFIFVAIAFALLGGGLLSSLFHLGHPERFLKALTQWRSSWLSREGILSFVTMGTFGLYALLWIFADARINWLGYIAAASALLTVFATSMIYAQMKSIPRWHSSLTPAIFVMYALAGGALLATQTYGAGVLFLLIVPLQVLNWVIGDRALTASGSNIGTATGLGHLGKVRLLEKPHSGTNYLMQEMVYVIGRKHAAKLRLFALAFGSLLPAALLVVFPASHIMALLVVVIHLIGLFAQRWLFFAEAEHVVGFYYDQR